MNNSKHFHQNPSGYFRPQPSSTLYNDLLYPSLSSSLNNQMYKTAQNFSINHIRGFSDSPGGGRGSNWQKLKDEILSPGDEENSTLLTSSPLTNLSVYSGSSKPVSSLNTSLISRSNNRSSTPSWKKNFSNTSVGGAYLPYESSNGKKTLILDLDETLVHSAFKPFYFKADMTLNVKYDGDNHPVHVLKRPYVDEFLSKMSQHFEIVVFTASISQYANPLLDRLDINNVITHRLFREHCVYNRGLYIKDLRKLGRELKDMIIVDNNPVSYTVNQDNGIPIPTWHYDKTDTELLKLIPILEFLAYVDDVRGYVKKIVSGNEIDFKIANAVINNNKKNSNTSKFPYYIQPSPSYNNIQQRKIIPNQKNIRLVNLDDLEDKINNNRSNYNVNPSQLSMNYSQSTFSTNMNKSEIYKRDMNNTFNEQGINRNGKYIENDSFTRTGTAFNPQNINSFKSQMSYTPKINYRSQMEGDANNNVPRLNKENKFESYTGTYLNRRHDLQSNNNNYFINNNEYPSITTSPNININIVNQNVSNLVLNERNRKTTENLLNESNSEKIYRKQYKEDNIDITPSQNAIQEKKLLTNNFFRTINVNEEPKGNKPPSSMLSIGNLNNQFISQEKQFGLYNTINSNSKQGEYQIEGPKPLSPFQQNIDSMEVPNSNQNDISLDNTSSNYTPNFPTLNDYQNYATNTTEEEPPTNSSLIFNRSLSQYQIPTIDTRPKPSLFSSSLSYIPTKKYISSNIYTQDSKAAYQKSTNDVLKYRMLTPNRRYNDELIHRDFYNSRSVERIKRDFSPNRRMYNSNYLQERENNLAFGRYNNINQPGNLDYMKYNLQFRRPFAYNGGKEYNYSNSSNYYFLPPYQNRSGDYY